MVILDFSKLLVIDFVGFIIYVKQLSIIHYQLSINFPWNLLLVLNNYELSILHYYLLFPPSTPIPINRLTFS